MLTVVKLKYIHRHSFDKCSIRRTEITNAHGGIRDRDFTMMRGDGRVIDDEIIALATTDPVESGFEINLPSLRCAGVDD